MIADNYNQKLSNSEIRKVIKSTRKYMRAEEFLGYNQDRLKYIEQKFKEDQELEYQSPPMMLRPGRTHPEAPRLNDSMEVN